ncbi:MAG: hypothetical protein R2849_14795 [Thermomicrobiales bacterium]
MSAIINTRPSASAASTASDLFIGLNRGTISSLVDSPAQLSEILTGLVNVGIDRSSVEIIRTMGGDENRTGIVTRIAGWLSSLGPEREILQHYQHEVNAGSLLLVIRNQSQELRNRAAEILLASGGHYINDFGPFTVRLVAP